MHGGGVFMYQTVRELARLCDLHLIVLLDHEREREAHAELDRICASTEYVVRLTGRQKALGSAEPHAPREFRNRDLAWLIHRQIYTRSIDVLQLEYLVMGQYAGRFRHIPSILFEHDVYFQSIARRLPYMSGVLERTVSRWEYLRAIRYELKLLPRLDRVQVCSRDNAEYLRSFLPQLNGRLDDGYRAGIDTSGYEFRPSGREPYTLLFLGSFRHLPNVEALQWFLQEVFPRIRKDEPRARLVIVGSDPPPRHSLRDSEAIEMIGFVEDVREPLMRYSLFVCPILAGSGVRVKLLEAFAAGIPVVSTRLGAEGLADQDGEICALADDPAVFRRACGSPAAASGGSGSISPARPGRSRRQARYAGDDRTAGGVLSRGGREECGQDAAQNGTEATDLEARSTAGLKASPTWPLFAFASRSTIFSATCFSSSGCVFFGRSKVLHRTSRLVRFTRKTTPRLLERGRMAGWAIRVPALSDLSLSALILVDRGAIQFGETLLETRADPIGENCVRLLRIGDHLEHSRRGELQRQILVESAGHGKQIHGLHSEDLGMHRNRKQGAERASAIW